MIPEQTRESQALTLPAVENPHIIYSLSVYPQSLCILGSSISMVPHPWIQLTADCVGLKYLLLKKHLHIADPPPHPLKPVLFNGPLYNNNNNNNNPRETG